MKMKLVCLFMLGVLCILNAPAMAGIITMTLDDSSGTTSFNTGLHWSDGLAPAAGNDYQNNNFLLRTPGTTTTSYTFGGDSLLITSASALGVDLNDALIFKGSFAGTTTITVNNLTVNGGVLRNGSGDSNLFALAGNGLTVGSLGMAVHAQGPIFVNAPVIGSGQILIKDNGSNAAGRILHFASASNTYNGSISLPTANRSRFTLDAGANMNFAIGTSGVNNIISGAGVATFNGLFNFDLSGASTNLGDNWTVASGTTAGAFTYGSTFAVNGFTADVGGDLWTGSANGASYQYSKSTGILTVVPEPATILMILTGALGIGMFWLRRK